MFFFWCLRMCSCNQIFNLHTFGMASATNLAIGLLLFLFLLWVDLFLLPRVGLALHALPAKEVAAAKVPEEDVALRAACMCRCCRVAALQLQFCSTSPPASKLRVVVRHQRRMRRRKAQLSLQARLLCRLHAYLPACNPARPHVAATCPPRTLPALAPAPHTRSSLSQPWPLLRGMNAASSRSAASTAARLCLPLPHPQGVAHPGAACLVNQRTCNDGSAAHGKARHAFRCLTGRSEGLERLPAAASRLS
jgi:hypothetical protein